MKKLLSTVLLSVLGNFPKSCRLDSLPDISQYIRVVLKFPEELTNVYSFDLKGFILKIW